MKDREAEMQRWGEIEREREVSGDSNQVRRILSKYPHAVLILSTYRHAMPCHAKEKISRNKSYKEQEEMRL